MPSAMAILVDSSDLTKLQVSVKKFPFFANRRIRRANRKAAEVCRDLVKEHASGRPGPRRWTDDYYDSIIVEFVKDSDSEHAWRAVSRHPAAWRLEFGFVGTDSSGRVYHQPPFPHWRPALEIAAQMYYDDASKEFFEAWKEAA